VCKITKSLCRCTIIKWSVLNQKHFHSNRYT